MASDYRDPDPRLGERKHAEVSPVQGGEYVEEAADAWQIVEMYLVVGLKEVEKGVVFV